MGDGQDAKGGTGRSRLPLPAVGTVVGIMEPDGRRPWRTRVEWTEEHSLCVVAPLRPAGESWAITAGDRLEVVWSSELGLLQASGNMRAADRDVVDLWVLDIDRVERSQRRQAFRLPLLVPVVLQWQQREVSGETCDLSETGVRCRVAARSAPTIGETLALTLTVANEETLQLTGDVRRVEPVPRTIADRTSVAPPAPEVDLGIVFAGLGKDVSERLRRFVFEEQLRRRAGG